MRQSKFHRDIPDEAGINVPEFEHIAMNDKDELIGYSGVIQLWEGQVEQLDIDDKIRVVGELIERKARQLEAYTELAAGLIIQRALPDAKIVRKKK